MLNWLNPHKSDALENAKARARERAREGLGESADPVPGGEGMVVEELSAEEFLRLFPQGERAR